MNTTSRTETRHLFVSATFFGRLGDRFESARLVCLAFLRSDRDHPTMKAAVENQIAEWTAKHGCAPVITSVL